MGYKSQSHRCTRIIVKLAYPLRIVGSYDRVLHHKSHSLSDLCSYDHGEPEGTGTHIH